jgi:cytochrome c oxidase assembly protein subunit 15
MRSLVFNQFCGFSPPKKWPTQGIASAAGAPVPGSSLAAGSDDRGRAASMAFVSGGPTDKSPGLASRAGGRHYCSRKSWARRIMAVAEHPVASVIDWPAARAARPAVRDVRGYWAVVSVLALAAFVLGVENRFTVDGLFLVPPRVDWLPPLFAQDWLAPFAEHQQDPVFAACGGTETMSTFRFLYWWEWWRRASIVALALAAAVALGATYARQGLRRVLTRIGGMAILLLAFWLGRRGLDLAIHASATMSSFNTGQYRHAIDVVFASAAVAAVVSWTVSPRRAPTGQRNRAEWIWLGAILIDICFGALFAARNAAAAWPTWPGYEGGALPPLAQLVSYSPWWLNVSFNAYTIQLVHRALSTVMWIAALWQLVSALVRAAAAHRAALRLVLISVQALTGIAALVLGVPAGLSVVHQVGAIVMLTTSLAFLRTGADGPIAVEPRGLAAQVRRASR